MRESQTQQNTNDLIRRLIEAIGDDPNREGLRETPRRVIKSWSELFSGYASTAEEHIKTFELGCDEIVAVRNISFFSTCEHHLLPFFGKVAIGYLPNGGRVLGLSKLARVVEVYSRRLQIQERLTNQIAESVMRLLKPEGVSVIVRAQHLCMMARGVRQAEAMAVTSAQFGRFRDDAKARAEVFALLEPGNG